MRIARRQQEAFLLLLGRQPDDGRLLTEIGAERNLRVEPASPGGRRLCRRRSGSGARLGPGAPG